MPKKKTYTYVPPETVCAYLPDRMSQLEYRVIDGLTKADYLTLVQNGWRRFGHMLFKPRCPACTACQPIRILVDQFQPDRSQRRVAKANRDTVLIISEPVIDEQRMDLYYRHHKHHADQKGWPEPDMGHGYDHVLNIVDGPFPVEEWAYYVDGKLVAISYIDHLAEGYSGIYFVHDPEYRDRSLGNWICLSLIEQAKANRLPFVYLGYYIQGCRSMDYKGRFAPSQVLSSTGEWIAFK
jgi:leucyl-tRNA---protein transferase